MNLNYFDAYRDIRNYLIGQSPHGTKQITKNIKEYFQTTYKNLYVLPSNNHSEFLLDVLVTDFIPTEILKKDKQLTVREDPLSVFIAVESELGGSGGSSAYGIMKNAVEDFTKLMIVKSKYKIFFFTSLPYQSETDHIIKRVARLADLCVKIGHTPEGVLVIHFEGSQPSSTQVQATVSTSTIRGFFISPDGGHYGEIMV